MQQWGIPSRVRSDKGGENTKVWGEMVELNLKQDLITERNHFDIKNIKKKLPFLN